MEKHLRTLDPAVRRLAEMVDTYRLAGRTPEVIVASLFDISPDTMDDLAYVLRESHDVPADWTERLLQSHATFREMDAALTNWEETHDDL